MTLLERYNNLLQLTSKIVKYNRLRKGRGYLTIDEKKELCYAERKLEKLVSEQPKQMSL